jgi:hypothetical protein
MSLVELSGLDPLSERKDAFDPRGPEVLVRFKSLARITAEVGQDYPDVSFDLAYIRGRGAALLTRKSFKKNVQSRPDDPGAGPSSLPGERADGIEVAGDERAGR